MLNFRSYKKGTKKLVIFKICLFPWQNNIIIVLTTKNKEWNNNKEQWNVWNKAMTENIQKV